jgi:mRNA interferase MazF
MAKAPRKIGFPKRGEVYIVAFDPTRGAEIKKTRPAVVIQNDVDNQYSPLTIVAPITSKFDDKVYPTEVLVRAPEGGLKVDSVVSVNQLRAVDKGRVERRLGTLKPVTMTLVNEAIAISLALIEF